MLQKPFDMLRSRWDTLSASSMNLISHLESKRSEDKDTDTTRTVEKALSDSKSLMTSMDQQIQRTNPDDATGVQFAAKNLQNYLEITEPLHQQLTHLSQGDDKALEHASSVKVARAAVGEVTNEICELTSVHVMSTTLPGGGQLSENVSTLEAVPVSADTTDEQVKTWSTKPGSEPSTSSTGVIASPEEGESTQGYSKADQNRLKGLIQAAVESSMQKYSTCATSATGGSTQAQAPPSGQTTTSSIPDSSQPSPSSKSLQVPLIYGQTDDVLFWLKGQKKVVIQLTRKLLDGPLEKPKDQKRLTRLTVDGLIAAWKKAVKELVKDVASLLTTSTLSRPEQITVAISELVFVHKQLQTLYNNLNATINELQPVTIQL